MSNLTHGVTFVKVLCLPPYISFIINIVFSRIITSCDGFYIPLYKTVFLNCHHVIKIYDGEQVKETNNAPSKQSEYLSINLLILWNQTRHLHIHHSIFIANICFLFTVFYIRWSTIQVPIFSVNCTILLIITLFNNSFVHCNFVQVASTGSFRLDVRRVRPNCFFSTVNHCFESSVHHTNLRVSNVYNSDWARKVHFFVTKSLYVTTDRWSSVVTKG